MMTAKTRNHNGLAVTIQPVAGQGGDYLASFHSEPLDATFSVYFHDNLAGALALHAFAEMLRKKYEVDEVRLELTDQAVLFKSRAVLDVLASGRRINTR